MRVHSAMIQNTSKYQQINIFIVRRSRRFASQKEVYRIFICLDSEMHTCKSRFDRQRLERDFE